GKFLAAPSALRTTGPDAGAVERLVCANGSYTCLKSGTRQTEVGQESLDRYRCELPAGKALPTRSFGRSKRNPESSRSFGSRRWQLSPAHGSSHFLLSCVACELLITSATTRR